MGKLRDANSASRWDELWAQEGKDSWRGKALAEVYDRIASLLPHDALVTEYGCGVGQLAELLSKKRADVRGLLLDHSGEALRIARVRSGSNWRIKSHDLENPSAGEDFYVVRHRPKDGVTATVVATEVLEHLSNSALDHILRTAADVGFALFSVPNDRLGPDEEPQHARKWTALEFKRHLERYFQHVRVECLGPLVEDTRAPAFLLAVCTTTPQKAFRMAVTLPVRDEAVDLPLTLASFRGVADLMVVGVDPRTTDDTREQAAKYADEVFDLADPEGLTQSDPPVASGDSPNRVHFAWLRNQCIERCVAAGVDWIFMTEGHEHLSAGVDVLLALDRIMPPGAKVACVMRRATGQRWGFPWLISTKDDRLRYRRSTHNVLCPPDDVLTVRMPQVQTTHRRCHDRYQERVEQRRFQNRITMMSDWVLRGNINSLFYLATEWRPYDKTRSIEWFREYCAVSKNGAGRYQARLTLAKELAEAGDLGGSREQLLLCSGDDWSRTEHYMWLGDLAFESDQFEEALHWYRLSATSVGHEMPFTLWWIDEATYTYLPAQRLAMTLARLGEYREAYEWAERVIEQLPPEIPQEVKDEARQNAETLKEQFQ